MPKTQTTSFETDGAPPEKQQLPSRFRFFNKASNSEPSKSSDGTPSQPSQPAHPAVEHQDGGSSSSSSISSKKHQQKEDDDKDNNSDSDEKNVGNNSSQASSIAASTSTGVYIIKATSSSSTGAAGTAAASRSSSSSYPTFSFSHHHHRNQQQKPAASIAASPAAPLDLQPILSPAKQGQQSVLKRASHSFISRGRRRDRDKAVLSPESKHAQLHSSAPRFSLASRAASNSAIETLAHSDVVRNMSITDASSNSGESLIASKPFVIRNGRSYFNDTSLPYPLPVDLTELHRQSMRTLLLIQVFGSPVCSPVFNRRPPQSVLEIGCGSGFWSIMCHRFFKSRGHGNISFTGIDIAPLAPTGPTINTCGGNSGGGASSVAKPDEEMNWRFINHDLRQLPWPLDKEEYDLVMVKDMSLATTNFQYQSFVDEYIRLLKPGGVLEIWESDHPIRMLRPHVPDVRLGGEENEDQEAATSLGAYIITRNTPLSSPLNGFFIDYNLWLSRALETRDLCAVPCTLIGPTLLQESEALADVRSRRLAIPLSEVRWEREGVGGCGGANKEKTWPEGENRVLSAGQEAVRSTALLTVVQQVQALGPMLREESGKSQDEWDVWLGKMMGDLMNDGGTSWGESLEVGAWSATKRNG